MSDAYILGVARLQVLCQVLRPAAHQTVKKRRLRPLNPPRGAGAPKLRAKTLEGPQKRKADVRGLLPPGFLLKNLGLSSARDQSQVRRNLRAPPKARSVEGARKDKASVHC